MNPRFIGELRDTLQMLSDQFICMETPTQYEPVDYDDDLPTEPAWDEVNPKPKPPHGRPDPNFARRWAAKHPGIGTQISKAMSGMFGQGPGRKPLSHPMRWGALGHVIGAVLGGPKPPPGSTSPTARIGGAFTGTSGHPDPAGPAPRPSAARPLRGDPGNVTGTGIPWTQDEQQQDDDQGLWQLPYGAMGAIAGGMLGSSIGSDVGSSVGGDWGGVAGGLAGGFSGGYLGHKTEDQLRGRDRDFWKLSRYAGRWGHQRNPKTPWVTPDEQLWHGTGGGTSYVWPLIAAGARIAAPAIGRAVATRAGPWIARNFGTKAAAAAPGAARGATNAFATWAGSGSGSMSSTDSQPDWADEEWGHVPNSAYHHLPPHIERLMYPHGEPSDRDVPPTLYDPFQYSHPWGPSSHNIPRPGEQLAEQPVESDDSHNPEFVQMMNALRANDQDWQTRLVLADWLDEHGHSGWAIYHRAVAEQHQRAGYSAYDLNEQRSFEEELDSNPLHAGNHGIYGWWLAQHGQPQQGRLHSRLNRVLPSMGLDDQSPQWRGAEGRDRLEEEMDYPGSYAAGFAVDYFAPALAAGVARAAPAIASTLGSMGGGEDYAGYSPFRDWYNRAVGYMGEQDFGADDANDDEEQYSPEDRARMKAQEDAYYNDINRRRAAQEADERSRVERRDRRPPRGGNYAAYPHPLPQPGPYPDSGVASDYNPLDYPIPDPPGWGMPDVGPDPQGLSGDWWDDLLQPPAGYGDYPANGHDYNSNTDLDLLGWEDDSARERNRIVQDFEPGDFPTPEELDQIQQGWSPSRPAEYADYPRRPGTWNPNRLNRVLRPQPAQPTPLPPDARRAGGGLTPPAKPMPKLPGRGDVTPENYNCHYDCGFSHDLLESLLSLAHQLRRGRAYADLDVPSVYGSGEPLYGDDNAFGGYPETDQFLNTRGGEYSVGYHRG